MHLSQRLLEWFDSCFNRNNMLYNASVIHLRSSYVQANTYLYYLKKLVNLLLSLGEQHFPKFTYLGSTFDPKFTSSNCIDELCILILLGLLNLLFGSNIPSKFLTTLGMKYPLHIFSWCSLSSIIAPLKFSSFVRNYKICGSS